jgi:hypothetical protein
MGERVILHIGAMKSGTSFLQSSLTQNQQALAAEGVSFLGGSFGKQSKAVREVLQPPGHEVKPAKKARWRSLIEEAASEDRHTSVVSMEFLSFAREEAVGRLLEPLAGYDVRVVVTLRDQFRAIPAQWQTYTRNQGQDDWATYLRNIRAGRSGRRMTRAQRTFERAQHLAPVLERWGTRPEVNELAVVTVPRPGSPKDELWLRFCTATGIAAEVADLSSVRDNPSLGYASCDYLRRINGHLAKVPPRLYRRGIRPLAREALVHLRDEEGRPPLDAEAAAFARERNDELRAAIEAHADRLVGSLDDLPVADAGDPPRRVPPPPHEQVVRAAEVGWDHTARLVDGDAGARPADLEPLVADGARLMRLAHGWRG